MLSRIIAILILAAILFFPAKFVFNKIQKSNQINKSATLAAKDLELNSSQLAIEENASSDSRTSFEESVDKIPQTDKSDKANKKVLAKEELKKDFQKAAGEINKLKSTPLSSEKLIKREPQEEKVKSVEKAETKQVAEDEYTFWDYLTDLPTGGIESRNQEAFDFAESQTPLSVRRASLAAAQETLKLLRDYEIEPVHSITEAGSTPAQFIFAKVPSPVHGLSYELNAVQPSGCNLRLAWKIKNETGREFALTEDVRRALTPSKARIQDYSFQNVFPIRWYNDNTPIANCMLSDSIPAYGRVECSALFGSLFDNNDPLRSPKVRIFLPGQKEPLNIYLNV
ncbi:MAG: hypothetical protein SFU25_01020 [Candidatus Caenarcaniphilales bacterium]|nr:hypothetical protein [Candidatus Caenarcaniphilales bacterium]